MTLSPIPAVLRKFENLHILLWLIKDSCWMLEIKWLGTLMILPTVAVAVGIVWMCRASKELYINLAVLCWILANSAWMLMEFYNKEAYKLYTVFPFALGFIFTLYFYLLIFKEKRNS